MCDQVDPNRRSIAFVEAAVACGQRRNPDVNGEFRDGAGLYQVTTPGVKFFCARVRLTAPSC